MGDESNVSFTTKEMLAKMDAKLDAIGQQLIGKADLSAVVSLNMALEDLARRVAEMGSRVNSMEVTGAGANHERRIVALEQSDAIYTAQKVERKYLYGALLTLISVLIGVGGLILAVN